jgi:hypothetical protein
MTNTVQMHKHLQPRQRFKPVLIKHQLFLQRSYVPLGRDRAEQRQAQPPGKRDGPAASAGAVSTGLASEEHLHRPEAPQRPGAA